MPVLLTTPEELTSGSTRFLGGGEGAAAAASGPSADGRGAGREAGWVRLTRGSPANREACSARSAAIAAGVGCSNAGSDAARENLCHALCSRCGAGKRRWTCFRPSASGPARSMARSLGDRRAALFPCRDFRVRHRRRLRPGGETTNRWRQPQRFRFPPPDRAQGAA